MAAAGAHPTWHEEPVTMSEAAALQNSATVVRMMRDGDDPLVRLPVRAGLLAPTGVTVTPLEAAIAARRADVLDIVLWSMHTVDGQTWTHLRCVAAGFGNADVLRVLDQYKPAAVNSSCPEVVRLW